MGGSGGFVGHLLCGSATQGIMFLLRFVFSIVFLLVFVFVLSPRVLESAIQSEAVRPDNRVSTEHLRSSRALKVVMVTVVAA